MKQQRRGRKIAMTPDEIDTFLADERTCRVATLTASGHPHVAPLWFVWDGKSLWLYSIVKSQRWTNLTRNPDIAIVIDAGKDYFELRGVEILGRAVVVGEVPRTDAPDPILSEPESLFARKYFDTDRIPADHKHAWLRITPDKLTSWNFAKLNEL